MTLILSALLVAAQLPVASDANDLEMALVKTLTQKEVKSLLEILTTFTDDIPKDAPPVFDFGQFQSLDGETKAKLLPKLKKRNFTLDSFTESMTALFLHTLLNSRGARQTPPDSQRPYRRAWQDPAARRRI